MDIAQGRLLQFGMALEQSLVSLVMTMSKLET